MFQLSEAVKHWRAWMAYDGTVCASDLDELESHLRDDIDQLVNLGLSEEEGYLVAAHRLGTPPELAAEYGKVNTELRWARRLLWMLAGYVAVVLTLRTAGSLGQWFSAGFMISGWTDSPLLWLLPRVAVPMLLAVALIVLAVTPKGRGLAADAADSLVLWGRRHPAMLLGVVIVLYLITGAGDFGRQIVISRFLGAEMLGQEAYHAAYLNLGAAFLVPAAILALLGWTYRRTRTQ